NGWLFLPSRMRAKAGCGHLHRNKACLAWQPIHSHIRVFAGVAMSILTDIVHRASRTGDSSSAAEPQETPPPQPATDGATTQAGVNTEVLARQANSSATPTGQSVQAMHDRKCGSGTK